MPTKDFLEDKQQITLYPTKSQHKKLKELAEKRGKSLSGYILDSAFRDEKIHEKLDKIISVLDGDSAEEVKYKRIKANPEDWTAIVGNVQESPLEPNVPVEKLQKNMRKLGENMVDAAAKQFNKGINKPTIPELKEKIKKMETNQVNTLFKGQK